MLWSETDQDGFISQRMSKTKKNEGYSSPYTSIDCLLKMPVLFVVPSALILLPAEGAQTCVYLLASHDTACDFSKIWSETLAPSC